MSSMRPPMLAGPMPRKINRFNIGSVDKFIGVGVGLGVGAGVAVRVGVGLGEPAGVCVVPGCWPSIDLSARTAQALRLVMIKTSVEIATINPHNSRVRSLVCFIGEIPFGLC